MVDKDNNNLDLDVYLKQCNGKWKGKELSSYHRLNLYNIYKWIERKCKENDLNYKDYEIYSLIVKEYDRQEELYNC